MNIFCKMRNILDQNALKSSSRALAKLKGFKILLVQLHKVYDFPVRNSFDTNSNPIPNRVVSTPRLWLMASKNRQG